MTLNNKIQFKFINLSDNLLSSYKCLKNYSKNPDLNNIVIQPQSKTEEIIPYILHIHLMYHKLVNTNKNNEKV